MLRQYIGARYVPKIDGVWNAGKAYEPLTIVMYPDEFGSSYTSKTSVPAGVDPTDSDYWALTGTYNSQISTLQNDVNAIKTDVINLTNDLAATDSTANDAAHDATEALSHFVQGNYSAQGVAGNTSGIVYLKKNLDVCNITTELTFTASPTEKVPAVVLGVDEQLIKVFECEGNPFNLNSTPFDADLFTTHIADNKLIGVFDWPVIVRSTSTKELIGLSLYCHYDGNKTEFYTHISDVYYDIYQLFTFNHTFTFMI